MSVPFSSPLLDATLSSRARAADYTAGRAADLDAAISSLAAAADWTAGRAANLDVAISTLAAAADWTAGRGAIIDTLDPTTRVSAVGGIASPTAGVGAWVYGAWTQLDAAAFWTGHALIAVIWTPPLNAILDRFQVQIGAGGAGAEAVIAALWIGALSTTAAQLPPFLVSPAVVIPAGARTAVRCASSAGNQVPGSFALVGMPVPF